MTVRMLTTTATLAGLLFCHTSQAAAWAQTSTATAAPNKRLHPQASTKASAGTNKNSAKSTATAIPARSPAIVRPANIKPPTGAIKPAVSVSADNFRLPGSNNELNWNSVNDGLALAKRLGKPMLIDVYTDWCGWCKVLDKQTFHDPSVAKLLSQQFILIKCDAEDEGQGQAFVEKMHVPHMYPLVLILEPNGQPKGGMAGFKEPDIFKAKIADIMNGTDKDADPRIPSKQRPIPNYDGED